MAAPSRRVFKTSLQGGKRGMYQRDYTCLRQTPWRGGHSTPQECSGSAFGDDRAGHKKRTEGQDAVTRCGSSEGRRQCTDDVGVRIE